MRRALTVVAVSVAALPASTSAALAVPGVGPRCQFARTNAHQVLSHGRTGVMTAGPFYVPGATQVTLTCAIQQNSTDPATPDSVAVSRTTSGSVGFLLVPDVRYTAAPHDTAYVCTTVSWSGRTSGSAWLGCTIVPLG